MLKARDLRTAAVDFPMRFPENNPTPQVLARRNSSCGRLGRKARSGLDRMAVVRVSSCCASAWS